MGPRFGLAALCVLAAAIGVRAGGAVSPAPVSPSPPQASSTHSRLHHRRRPGGTARPPRHHRPPRRHRPPRPHRLPAPPALPAGYVGSDTCVACHTAEEESLKGTPHGQAHNPRSPAAAHGCESCHGPGQAHVDDEQKGHIQKFTQMTPARSTGRASPVTTGRSTRGGKAARTNGATCRVPPVTAFTARSRSSISS